MHDFRDLKSQKDALKKEIPEGRASALKRRIDKKKKNSDNKDEDTK